MDQPLDNPSERSIDGPVDTGIQELKEKGESHLNRFLGGATVFGASGVTYAIFAGVSKSMQTEQVSDVSSKASLLSPLDLAGYAVLTIFGVSAGYMIKKVVDVLRTGQEIQRLEAASSSVKGTYP